MMVVISKNIGIPRDLPNVGRTVARTRRTTSAEIRHFQVIKCTVSVHYINPSSAHILNLDYSKTLSNIVYDSRSTISKGGKKKHVSAIERRHLPSGKLSKNKDTITGHVKNKKAFIAC